MYKLVVGKVVYLFNCVHEARKAYHEAVEKNGINNVEVTYYD